MEIGIDKKIALTVEEAAEYSNIGENTLRSLMKCPEFQHVVLHVGRRLLIKRVCLEQYINEAQYIDVK